MWKIEPISSNFTKLFSQHPKIPSAYFFATEKIIKTQHKIGFERRRSVGSRWRDPIRGGSPFYHMLRSFEFRYLFLLFIVDDWIFIYQIKISRLDTFVMNRAHNGFSVRGGALRAALKIAVRAAKFASVKQIYQD